MFAPGIMEDQRIQQLKQRIEHTSSLLSQLLNADTRTLGARYSDWETPPNATSPAKLAGQRRLTRRSFHHQCFSSSHLSHAVPRRRLPGSLFLFPIVVRWVRLASCSQYARRRTCSVLVDSCLGFRPPRFQVRGARSCSLGPIGNARGVPRFNSTGWRTRLFRRLNTLPR